MLFVWLNELFGVLLNTAIQFFLDNLNTWLVGLLGFGEEE